MSDTPIPLRGRNYSVFYLVPVLIAIGIYGFFTFFVTPPITASSERLGLTGATLSIVRFSFIIPYIAIWIIGVLAAAHLKRCQMIYAPRDVSYHAYRLLSNGVLMLIGGLVLSALIGLPRTFYPLDDTLYRNSTIIINYIQILAPLFGFFFIFKASKHFYATSQDRVTNNDDTLVSAVIAGILGTLISILVFSNPARQTSVDPMLRPTYYISDPLIVLTLLAPLFIVWFFGFRAALGLGTFLPNTKKEEASFSTLTDGLFLIIFSSIVLQGITALGAERFIAIGLGFTLFALYLFLAILGIGYGMVWQSSEKMILQK